MRTQEQGSRANLGRTRRTSWSNSTISVPKLQEHKPQLKYTFNYEIMTNKRRERCGGISDEPALQLRRTITSGARRQSRNLARALSHHYYSVLSCKRTARAYIEQAAASFSTAEGFPPAVCVCVCAETRGTHLCSRGLCEYPCPLRQREGQFAGVGGMAYPDPAPLISLRIPDTQIVVSPNGSYYTQCVEPRGALCVCLCASSLRLCACGGPRVRAPSSFMSFPHHNSL